MTQAAGRFVGRLFDDAGIDAAGVLVVHAGFRTVGAQGLSPEDVAKALVARMSRGTLLMPAMSWRIATLENPVFDARTTPGHVGVLAERFRIGFATHRSVHPTHSFAGVGPAAAHCLDAHHRDSTPCGPNSPFARLRGLSSQILMLGCDLSSCTSFHHAEETVAPDVYLRDERETYECRNLAGEKLQVVLRRHRRLARDFPAFAAPLAATGDLRTGASGGTGWIAVGHDALVERTLAALRADPQATISHAARAKPADIG